jgi:hypothetical protein
MDHATWAQRNLEAAKRIHTTARDRRRAEEGRGWIAAPAVLTPFQRRAFTILGIVGNGIYNAPIEWDTIYWGHGRAFISLSWRNSLSTFDFSALTSFVFMCHEARIRGEIRPKMRYLEITMSERKADGSISHRHPNLEEAVAQFRQEMGDSHSIKYRDQAIEVAA